MSKAIHSWKKRGDGGDRALCSAKIKYNPETVVKDADEVTCKRCLKKLEDQG